MDANDYQQQATTTARYPGQGALLGMLYTGFGLGGEAGEGLEKIKKLLRDGFKDLTDEQICQKLLEKPIQIPEETRIAIKKELGDVQWYVSAMARELHYTLGEVMQGNLDKLFDRRDRGQLHGSGDNR